MKNLFTAFLFYFIGFSTYSIAQTPTETNPITDSTLYRIHTDNGKDFIGYIIKNDPREILMKLTDNREIYIPQLSVEKIEKVDMSSFNANGDFVGEDKFATRYFITTNGLPLKRGENYIQWNLFGPDFQFGIGENLGIGLMTSWIGSPIIATIKRSFQVNETTHFAVGALAGWGSWSFPEFGGFLPYATFSKGNRKSNIAFSGGYGAIWTDNSSKADGRPLTSIAGMVKVSKKLSLVFDSFILLPSTAERMVYNYDPLTGTYEYVNKKVKLDALSILMPGIRWHQSEGKAIQFGFAGYIQDGDAYPIPMVQWYRSF